MSDLADCAAFLVEIRARLDASTPGPWEAITDDHGHKGLEHSVWSDTSGSYVSERIRSRPDAHFIAAAQSDIPRLLSALEAALKLHAGDMKTVQAITTALRTVEP